MRREGLPVQRVMSGAAIAEVASQLKYQSVDSMFTAIGEHHVSAQSVAGRVAKLIRSADEEREEVLPTPVRSTTATSRPARPASTSRASTTS